MSKVALQTVLAALMTIACANVCSAQSGIIVPLAPLAPDGAVVPSTAAPATAIPAAALSDVSTEHVIYDGGAIGDNGLEVSPWGGGSIAQDDTSVFGKGVHSLKIESPGFYQGGTIVFGAPVDLGDTTDKTKYLEMSIKLTTDPKYVTPPAATPDQTTPSGPLPPNAQNSYFSGSAASLFHLAQNPGGYNPRYGGTGPMPQGMPGGPGPGGQPGAPPTGAYTPEVEQAPPAFPAKSVHLIFTLSDGTQTDAVRVLPDPQEDQDWINIGLPLSKLRLNGAIAQPKLASVTVCTDSPTFINVGRIKFVTDATPITASTGGEKDVSQGENVVFNGRASGGASMLKYEWDFETNGKFVEQADGPYATHTYAKSGAYTVSLQVSDVDGIKAPATATTVVHVEE